MSHSFVKCAFLNNVGNRIIANSVYKIKQDRYCWFILSLMSPLIILLKGTEGILR